ncbi:hypothetical protein FB451DRAFT_1404633 [Mycena latifolia]|nr:hypothetical protein FB451DRAFT_1404633 [Mycena latifolia]
MIIQGGDAKGATEPSAGPAEAQASVTRDPSPPPAYSPSTSANPTDSASVAGSGSIQIVVQHPSPELSSAFRPPSPSSFPHPHPHTHMASAGPTPFFLPTVTPTGDGYYAYYDPRSPYSLALADRRALVRFWSAFGCNIVILVLMWLLGLIQFG